MLRKLCLALNTELGKGPADGMALIGSVASRRLQNRSFKLLRRPVSLAKINDRAAQLLKYFLKTMGALREPTVSARRLRRAQRMALRHI